MIGCADAAQKQTNKKLVIAFSVIIWLRGCLRIKRPPNDPKKWDLAKS